MANRKIEDVEGIGPVMGEKLRAAGIKDSDALLAQCASPAQRKALSEQTGIAPKMVMRFANMADLYRVPGIGAEYAELLEAAGVDTVPELAQRRADNLTKAMSQANEQRPMVRRLPTEKEVSQWIDHAKTLPRVLTY